jgi:hypothetical protein
MPTFGFLFVSGQVDSVFGCVDAVQTYATPSELGKTGFGLNYFLSIFYQTAR